MGIVNIYLFLFGVSVTSVVALMSSKPLLYIFNLFLFARTVTPVMSMIFSNLLMRILNVYLFLLGVLHPSWQ